jgi:hypothetical protein
MCVWYTAERPRYREIETVEFARRRNITALVIVAFLIAQSVQLFFGVVLEKFSVREIWHDISFDLRDTTPVLVLTTPPPPQFGVCFYSPSWLDDTDFHIRTSQTLSTSP